MASSITLKKNEDRRILKGHLWVFSNEIKSIEETPQAGDIVELRNHAGVFLGKGVYNPNSLIAVRLLSRNRDEPIDFQFFKQRIESALQIRQLMYPKGDTYRVVHGEADFLPGLIIDKYDDLLSLQTFSFGMDRRMTLLCDVLESLLHPRSIIERNETMFRQLEGLQQKKGLLRGTEHRTTIHENTIAYEVDLLEGQKTGFFLDQRENRRAFRRYVRGMRVLDCFCNDGGFSLNAASAGAREAVGIDSSESAVHNATRNAQLNKLEKVANFVCGDVFDFLKSAAARGEQFDVINLDPPSFAKNKRTVIKAKRGYSELHSLAFSVLRPNGILSTASCSHHIFEETFLDIINSSARKSHREISLLEWHGAAPDHPVLPAMPETRYLKYGIFRVG